MTAKPWHGGRVLLLGFTLVIAGPACGQNPDPSSSATLSTSGRLTQSKRAKLYLKSLFNPQSFLISAASAGFGQWRDRPPEWRQGGAGFGRRYASSFAQHATRETLKYGMANLLHEDNRYVPSGRTGFASRVIYAVESTFQSRSDDGELQVSYSNIGSLAGASLFSRTWQPKSTGGAGDGAVNFGVSVAFAAGLNVAREFLHR